MSYIHFLSKIFLQWNRLTTFLFSCDNIFRVIFGVVTYRLLSSKMNMFDNYLWFWHQPKVKEAYFGTYMVLNTPLCCFGSSKVVENQKIKSVYRVKYFNFTWFPGVEILRNLPWEISWLTFLMDIWLLFFPESGSN